MTLMYSIRISYLGDDILIFSESFLNGLSRKRQEVRSGRGAWTSTCKGAKLAGPLGAGGRRSWRLFRAGSCLPDGQRFATGSTPPRARVAFRK